MNIRYRSLNKTLQYSLAVMHDCKRPPAIFLLLPSLSVCPAWANGTDADIEPVMPEYESRLPLSPFSINAEETEPSDESSWLDQTTYWADETETYVADTVHDFSTYIDHSLAKEENEEELMNKSYVRIRYKPEYTHRGYFDSDFKISARIDLPHTKRDWKLILETDPDDYDSLESKQRALTPKSSSTTSGSDAIAGFRLQNAHWGEWKTHFDVGVKFKLPLDPFVRANLRRVDNLSENWTTQLKQELFYFDSKGLGSLTEFNFYYGNNNDPARIYKFSSSAQYLFDESGWELVNQIELFNRLNDHHLMEYSTGVSIDTNESDPLTNFWISASWRQKIYKDWLYLSITPQLDTPREFSHKLNPGVLIEIEAFFSKNHHVDRLNRYVPDPTRR